MNPLPAKRFSSIAWCIGRQARKSPALVRCSVARISVVRSTACDSSSATSDAASNASSRDHSP
jgi:hypothetical protein